MKYLIKVLFFFYSQISKMQQYFLFKYYRKSGAIIGKNTYLGPNVYLDVSHKPGKIVIGDNCYVTRNSSILVHSDAFLGGPLQKWKGKGGERLIGNIIIGDNVFIGFHCVVLPGVSIGDNAVIGAMTLVNKDVPMNAIVVGVPGKIVGYITDKVSIYNE